MGEKSAASFLKQLKSQGVYYTPPMLAERMKAYIDIEPIEEVYDPTAGQGNLFKVFGDEVRKYGQELDPVELQKCIDNIPNFEGFAGDTLKEDKYEGREFQVVFANPPYSVPWEPISDERWDGPGVFAPKGRADWAFGLHCLHHTKPDGVCVLLMFPGILYRGNSEQKIRKWLIENNYIERVVNMPGDYIGKFDKFADTNTSTVIIVMRKNKTTTDIIFEEPQYDKTTTVSIDKIREEDYNLSPSTYIERPDTREKIDIVAVSLEARRQALNRMETEMKLEYFTCVTFPDHSIGEFVQFVDDAEKIVKKWKKIAKELKENGKPERNPKDGEQLSFVDILGVM